MAWGMPGTEEKLLMHPLAMPRAGLLGLPVPDITPPDDRTVSQGDALADVFRGVAERVRQERAKSAEMGLWNDETGLPTGKGLLDATQQYTQGLLLGTSAPGIRAYHGSPHSFDRFSTERIGTGEGAQAYGHGLYFAEREGVARDYRDKLSQHQDRLIEGTDVRIPHWAANAIEKQGKSPTEIRDQFVSRIAEEQALLDSGTAQQPWMIEARIAGLKHMAGGLEKLAAGEGKLGQHGSMYEVNIAANPEHMLHWDKPLSEQSEYVRGRISGRTDWTTPDMPGSRFYGEMMNRAKRDPVAAAQQLNDMGIPGIRYLDQGSRGAGEGSHNLVVFDDATIEILRKYGLLGMVGGGASAGLLAGDEQ